MGQQGAVGLLARLVEERTEEERKEVALAAELGKLCDAPCNTIPS